MHGSKAVAAKLIANLVQKLVVVFFAQPVHCRFMSNQSEALQRLCRESHMSKALTIHMHARSLKGH